MPNNKLMSSGLPNNIPVVCDLDGTLIRTDLMHKAVIDLLWRQPWVLPPALTRLAFGGRLEFKRRLAKSWIPDPATLPYRTELVERLRQMAGTRTLVLASDRKSVV